VAEKAKITVRLYRFKNRLREKCAGLGVEDATISGDALAKAEAALSEMSEDYPDWVMKDIDKLQGQHRRCVDTPEDRKLYFEEIARLAHDMIGQGGTFGYPLITSFSNSLYKFAENTNKMEDRHVDIIKSHIDSMRAIIKGRIRGDGGDIGKQLEKGLHDAISKHGG
jgi:hypothetical protein